MLGIITLIIRIINKIVQVYEAYVLIAPFNMSIADHIQGPQAFIIYCLVIMYVSSNYKGSGLG